MIKAQRGTIDILPSEVAKWQFVENTARDVCKLHNVKEIRTPVFEATELFTRSSGESSDIVTKEMYTFLDKGNRSITLRPEGTAGIVRACVEHGLFNDAMPLKLYYILPSYRYEKPQSGRLREFRQVGIELFGSKSPKFVAESMIIGNDILTKLGIKNVSIEVNNLGCSCCRNNFTNAVKEYFTKHIDCMCEDCKRRLSQNPLRILDCKVESCKSVIKNAPKVSEILCEDCKNYNDQLIKILNNSNVNFKFNDEIIRGLDYYTGIVYEFLTTDIEGASAVIGGGGQYNNLVEELGGPSVPAVGFAFGVERLLMLLEKQKDMSVYSHNVDALIICMSSEYSCYETKLLNMLRQNGISADCDYMERSFRANFKYANKVNAKCVLVIGEEEFKTNNVTLKNMQSGEQKLVSFDKLVEVIKQEI